MRHFIPPYLVAGGSGLGGNRTVTRRQSGVSNRLQGAPTAPPSVTSANNPNSPTPSRQPFGILTNTGYRNREIWFSELEKKSLGSLSSCREPCTASAAGQQPLFPANLFIFHFLPEYFIVENIPTFLLKRHLNMTIPLHPESYRSTCRTRTTM